MDEYITKLTEVLDAKTLEIMKSGNVNRMNEFGQLLNIPVTELKNLVSAIESYESAFKINPDADYLLGRLIAAKKNLCNWNIKGTN